MHILSTHRVDPTSAVFGSARKKREGVCNFCTVCMICIKCIVCINCIMCIVYFLHQAYDGAIP